MDVHGPGSPLHVCTGVHRDSARQEGPKGPHSQSHSRHGSALGLQGGPSSEAETWRYVEWGKSFKSSTRRSVFGDQWFLSLSSPLRLQVPGWCFGDFSIIGTRAKEHHRPKRSWVGCVPGEVPQGLNVSPGVSPAASRSARRIRSKAWGY